jgi:hypothetical protein
MLSFFYQALILFYTVHKCSVMWKFISATIRKSTLSVYIGLINCFGLSLSAYSQQYVIADKDNTHPEITLQTSLPALITRFAVQRENDYAQIYWNVLREQDIRKYIIEYSMNGTDYETAGEVFTHDGIYTFRQRFADSRPALYRIKMELLNGKYFYSTGAILDGINISPVQIYPTIVQGSTVNVNAYWPVEKINIFSASGQQVFSKDINGERDYMAIVIPSLGKGIYWMNFYGQGWKSTSKFVVQ